MAKAKSCLGVDLGGQSVKIAEMAIDRGGLRVVRLLQAPVPLGPEAQQAERYSALASAVRDLMKTNKVATKNAVFSIPGQTVFIKRQLLPRATPSHLQNIVQIEARQQIPFPLDRMTLEYQVFDTDDPRQVEVLLGAMKRETNQEYMRLFRSTGLRVSGISISSLALFNGQELSNFNVNEYLDSGGKKKKEKAAKKKKAEKKKGKKGQEPEVAAEDEAAAAVAESGEEESLDEDFGEELDVEAGGEFEEIRAYVNVGARATDLAICRGGGGVGFVRSIPIGGNQVTQGILKQCECESFLQAETLKIERCAVQSAAFEFEADASQYDADACEVATKVCDRIVAELRRSLDYYISQPDGQAVDSIVLSGGAAKLAFLPGYIEERLGLPVEVAQSLGNPDVKTPSQYDESFDFSPFRVAIGLACQGLGISPVKIDFLPADVRGARDLSAQSLELVLLGGMLAGMVFFGSRVGSKTLGFWSTEIRRYDTMIQKHSPAKRKIEQLERERTSVKNKLSSLGAALDRRDFWIRVLAAVRSVKPPGVHITGVLCTVDPMEPWTGKLTMECEVAEDQKLAIANFKRRLTGLRPYGQGGNTVALRLKDVQAVESKYSKKKVQQFRIDMPVQEQGGEPIVRVLPTEEVQQEAQRSRRGRAPQGEGMIY